MSKHRRHNRKNKKPFPLGEGLGEAFFGTVLPFIENLEKEDKILLVLPTISSEGYGTQGIVLGPELTGAYAEMYVKRMAIYAKRHGGLEKFLMMRAQNPQFARKNDPAGYMLDLCKAARMVIAYRLGIKLGEDNKDGDESVTMPSLDDKPLFITMMAPSDDASELKPGMVGFELDGIIELKEYVEDETTETDSVATPSFEEPEA